MKKNKERLFGSLVICIMIAIFITIKGTIEYIFINKDHISNKIWRAIDNQLTQEHLKKIESDYVLHTFVGTPFEIRYYEAKSELVYDTEEKTIVILSDIITDRGAIQDDYPDYYIVASDGYGVITDSGVAIIFLKSGEKKFLTKV